MIIDLLTGQESLTSEGWDTTKTYSEQTNEVKAQASSKASQLAMGGTFTIESSGGNSRPQTITFVDGIALYTITPDYYKPITEKSFMLTRRILINITENII